MTEKCVEPAGDELTKKFAQEDRDNLAAIAHIPDNKLRENLAVAAASLRAVEDVFDKIEEMPSDMTSMETLEDRAAKVYAALSSLRGERDRYYEIVREQFGDTVTGPGLHDMALNAANKIRSLRGDKARLTEALKRIERLALADDEPELSEIDCHVKIAGIAQDALHASSEAGSVSEQSEGK